MCQTSQPIGLTPVTGVRVSHSASMSPSTPWTCSRTRPNDSIRTSLASIAPFYPRRNLLPVSAVPAPGPGSTDRSGDPDELGSHPATEPATHLVSNRGDGAEGCARGRLARDGEHG